MKVKAAATTQFFQHPDLVRAKLFMRSTFLLVGIAASAAMTTSDGSMIALVTGGVGLFLSAVVRGWGMKVAKQTPELGTFWSANSFSFLLMGGMLIPGGLYLHTMLGKVTVAAVAGLATLAGVVGFCAGRFLYVLLFGGAAPETANG